MNTLKTGDLAYYDSFAGLIPCKVLAITGRSGRCGSDQSVTVKLTAKRGAWKAGETIHAWGLHVCPRGSVRGNRIKPYNVEVV